MLQTHFKHLTGLLTVQLDY